MPEVLLWMQLKQRPGNYKFRKQHPYSRMNVDFYCDKAQLVIEVDGEDHNRGDQPAIDRQRDAFLNSQGLTVLRVAARDVLSNMDGVVRHILSTVDAAGDLSVSLHSPPLPTGEHFNRTT